MFHHHLEHSIVEASCPTTGSKSLKNKKTYCTCNLPCFWIRSWWFDADSTTCFNDVSCFNSCQPLSTSLFFQATIFNLYIGFSKGVHRQTDLWVLQSRCTTACLHRVSFDCTPDKKNNLEILSKSPTSSDLQKKNVFQTVSVCKSELLKFCRNIDE